MTYRPDKDSDYKEAMLKVQEALDSVAEHITPRDCAHGPWYECEDECSYSDTTVRDGYFIDSWVVVANVEPIDDSGDHMAELVVKTPVRMRLHTAVGLLAMAEDML